MILEVLVMALSLACDVITVDDDGPADFATIRGAVAAAHAGDVLLVQPGLYDDFGLGKPVSILGPITGESPRISGTVTVQGAGVTLAGLDFDQLRLTSIHDRVLVDACSTGDWNHDAPIAGVIVDHCDEVLFSRCQIFGSEGVGTNAPAGLKVTQSRVAIVQSKVRGGPGEDVTDEFGTGGNGGRGLFATGSDITIDASTIQGGEAGYGSLFGGPVYGGPGVGLDATVCTIIARGAAIHMGVFPAQYSQPSLDLQLDMSTEMVVSAVDYSPDEVFLGAGCSLEVAPLFEPFVEIIGDEAPGSTQTLLLSGPPDQPAVLFFGLVQDLVELHSLESPLWLRVQLAFLTLPVVTTGPASPHTIALDMPASFAGLEGTTLYVQAVFTHLESTLKANTIVVTNPAVIVVRF